MTSSEIISASYGAEKSYTHNLDNAIDPSDAVGAWGTAKESTTELSDLSGNNNIAVIKGPMPIEGFIQGRRFDGIDDYLDCGNFGTNASTLEAYIKINMTSNGRLICNGHWAWANGFILRIINGNVQFGVGAGGTKSYSTLITTSSTFNDDARHHIIAEYDYGNIISINIDGIKQSITKESGTCGTISGNNLDISGCTELNTNASVNLNIGRHPNGEYYNDPVYFVCIYNHVLSTDKKISLFNTLARLPFWSVNYTDYPDNVTEHTNNLPYSSSIISSGTFKVDDDKLQCVSAGTMTYSASYEFDGSEYIKVEIGGVEYAGTGTITQGNTTVSVAQGSNKVTIQMGTGDTIDGIDIQFREEV